MAQTSLIGSLLANGLLVLGLTIMVGARASEGGVMRFRPRLPNDTMTLLMLAVFIIVILGVATSSSDDSAATHAKAISAVPAICLLVVYGRLAALLPARRHRGDRRPEAPSLGTPSVLDDRAAGAAPAWAPRSSPTGSSPRSPPPSTRSGSRGRSRAS